MDMTRCEFDRCCRPACPKPVRPLVAALLTLGFTLELLANPEGLTVSHGSASVTTSGSRMDITASQNAFLNWQSFNIAPGQTTTFIQPSATSIVWNRINDVNPSQVWGNLNANGIVVLMNQSGFFFGPGSVVNAAGFVATTATTLPEFSLGGAWQFSGPPPAASIVNYGEIKVSSGGSAFLIAEKIENHGVLMAPDGTLGLYAGKNVLMSERPDGRGLSVQVQLPEGSVDNQGRLVADAGSILIHGQTVNQNGILQANSVQERNGVIELRASDTVNLGANSLIAAQGDGASVSSGGQVTIKSDGIFTDTTGSRVTVAGGALGGNAGQVEFSAPFMAAIHSSVDGRAQAGWTGGSLLIDPTDINIGTSGSGSANSGTVNAGDLPTTLNLDVNSAFLGLANITLQAKRNITVQNGTTWDLVQTTGVSGGYHLLSLEAGNNITIQNSANIQAGLGWSVSLAAGGDFTTANAITPGSGSILFQGTGSLQANDGSVTLRAGKDVTVASGFVRTVGGGSIDVTAVSGSVNTGTKIEGFQFYAQASVEGNDYMQVDPNLGGISTAAGGNVSLTAGLDITSYLPNNTGTRSKVTDGGSGAFGAAAGDVTLNAGRDVVGHYVLRNGVGTINAGRNAGTVFDATAGTKDYALALSLVSGGWNVTAGQDIILQEVRNPNGIYNSVNLPGSLAARHYFDYDPHAYVSLTAGNSVLLTGVSSSTLPRRSGTFEQAIPAIYAPSLSISAGAGGVGISDDIILAPSPVGQLNITTTGGGSLRGTKAGALVSLIMSDSGSSQYKPASSPTADFGAADHATAPLHVDDPQPVRLNISGDIGPHALGDATGGMLLVFPKLAEISVGGNMVNSRFNIQNLNSLDTTKLNVVGDILNTIQFTGVPLTIAPDFSPLARAVDPSLAYLAGQFSYDGQTHTLTFHGTMNSTEANALRSLQVYAIDPVTQKQLLDASGNPVIETVSILSQATVQALFDATQNLPQSPDTGYTIAGPGTFNLTAHDLDLGATTGIRSIGPLSNPGLARLGASGAAINVTLSGNLEMYSTAIASLAGGNIVVSAGGHVNVGSSVFTGDSSARGIFTAAKSDVSVTAVGNININGSRIAAYDGGGVTVVSLTGNVDAGHGGQGAVEVQQVYVDPKTGRVLTYTATIPGSGILATSFPQPLDPAFPKSKNSPGDITVLTPQGDIVASAGGIVQISLNNVSSTKASVTLVAGTKDEQGNVIYNGSIDASGSGVIGDNVHLEAAGGIKGLIVAQHDISISAQQNVNVTAIGSGSVSVSSGGTISGTIVGVGGVSASGASVDAAMLSQGGVTANNANVGSSQAFTSANAAGSTSQAAAASEEQQVKKTVVASNSDEEDEKKKRVPGSSPVLTRRTGRVTVILPKT